MKALKLFVISWFWLLSFSAYSDECFDLIAGQNTDVGDLCLSNTETELTVKYSTVDSWLLDDVHLFVGTSLDQMPATKKGNPKIGNFPYKAEGVNTNYQEFVISLASLGLTCDSSIVFAAHASVQKLIDGTTYQQETAWASGLRIVEKGSWATYGNFDLTCVSWRKVVDSCETAFALGDTTFIDLGLTNARWGWEITSVSAGSYSYPIYAGAGQNDISKGTLVGNLSVSYDGSTVVVDYNMLDGFVLDETHLYVGETHTTTIAPGQYGNIHDLDLESSDSYTLTGFTSGQLYIVAHAVSCTLK